MDEPTRLQFGPPLYKITPFLIEKKAQKVAIEMPPGSQILRADLPEHDSAHIYIWALVPTVSEEAKKGTTIIYDIVVAYENVPFGVEEQVVPEMLPDGSVVEGTYAHVHHLALWVEKTADGFRTGHVLEVVEGHDEDVHGPPPSEG